MDFFNIASVEELKKLGKFSEVKEELKKLLGDFKDIKWNSWNNVFNGIENYKKNLNKEPLKKSLKNKDLKKENLYFKSKASEYIFYLIELDGEIRLNKLGITKLHYLKVDKAKKWRNDISKVIHPDICTHPGAEEAMAKLSKLYSEMIGDDK